MIVLPKTRKEEASKVAKKIHECIENVPFVAKLSASIGMVESSEKDSSVEDIISRADKALYYAKTQKKGSIAVSNGEEEFYTVE